MEILKELVGGIIISAIFLLAGFVVKTISKKPLNPIIRTGAAIVIFIAFVVAPLVQPQLGYGSFSNILGGVIGTIGAWFALGFVTEKKLK